MTFGLRDSKEFELSLIRVTGAKNVQPFFDMFQGYGHKQVDTARIYGGGDTEKVISQLPTKDHFKIATKAYPMFDGAFSADQLEKQFRLSLEALNASKVDIFYLHAPDASTPLEVTVKAVNDLYKEGLFERVRGIWSKKKDTGLIFLIYARVIIDWLTPHNIILIFFSP